eukprot:1879781-Rhodomonas_salina.2
MQESGATLRGGEMEKFPQSLQLVPAVMLRYVARGQSTHRADPFAALKVPTSQATHEPPSGPENPALHIQSSSSSLPASEFANGEGHPTHAVPAVMFRYVPCAQSRHGEDPLTILKVPASHTKQLPPVGSPPYPTLH